LAINVYRGVIPSNIMPVDFAFITQQLLKLIL